MHRVVCSASDTKKTEFSQVECHSLSQIHIYDSNFENHTAVFGFIAFDSEKDREIRKPDEGQFVEVPFRISIHSFGVSVENSNRSNRDAIPFHTKRDSTKLRSYFVMARLRMQTSIS